MKRTLLAIVPLIVLLSGCTANSASDAENTTKPTMSDARENCLAAYRELPNAIATLEEQSGEPADTATPCDNWIESQGEADFIEFWTTPAKYIPYVISAGKVDASLDMAS